MDEGLKPMPLRIGSWKRQRTWPVGAPPGRSLLQPQRPRWLVWCGRGLAGISPGRRVFARESLPLTAKSSRRSEEHTSELQSRFDLVCRLLLEKKKKKIPISINI